MKGEQKREMNHSSDENRGVKGGKTKRWRDAKTLRVTNMIWRKEDKEKK